MPSIDVDIEVEDFLGALTSSEKRYIANRLASSGYVGDDSEQDVPDYNDSHYAFMDALEDKINHMGFLHRVGKSFNSIDEVLDESVWWVNKGYEHEF